jgi:hypothetical protein
MSGYGESTYGSGTYGGDDTSTPVAPRPPEWSNSPDPFARPVLRATTAVYLRHIRLGDGTEPGARDWLGQSFHPAATLHEGFAGEYTLTLNEHGIASLRLANADGEDGIKHLDRFDVIRRGRLTVVGGGGVYVGGGYRPGDEWIEVWCEGEPEPEFVGTPLNAAVTPTEITISLADGLWLGNHTYETDAAVWSHAHRDVFEHYAQRVHQVVEFERFQDDFPDITSSGSQQTTDDGRFTYVRATNDRANQAVRLSAPYNTTARLTGAIPLPCGTDSADPQEPWRFDVEFSLADDFFPDTNADLYFELLDDDGDAQITLDMTATTITVVQASPGIGFTGGQVTYPSTSPEIQLGRSFNISVECRDRYAWVFVNGQLIGIVLTPITTTIRPQLRIRHTNVGVTWNVNADFWMVRRAPRALADAGSDTRVAGAPSPGGLFAEYYDDNTNFAGIAPAARWTAMSGGFDPYAQQTESSQDQTLTTGGAVPWPPPGYTASLWSHRRYGSILLDLAAYDYRIRVTAHHRARLWVGRTRWDDKLAENWPGSPGPGAAVTITSPYLRTVLGELDGWWPIIVEHSVAAAGVVHFTIEYERSDDPGNWTVVPPDMVSPYGTYKARPAHDSHYEQRRAALAGSGLQSLLEPRSLESGEFPGAVSARLRAGWDTDYILDATEASGPSVNIAAEDTADCLIADAGGLQRLEGFAPYTVEAFNFDQLAGRPMLHEAYDTGQSDITEPNLLRQRLESLLTLRASPSEEVTAQPAGDRLLRGSFPVTGELAKLKWRPGDGVRLSLPSITVQDDMPRQIVTATQQFQPTGLAGTTVGFRQRTRSPRRVLRNLVRSVVAIGRPGTRTLNP